MIPPIYIHVSLLAYPVNYYLDIITHVLYFYHTVFTIHHTSLLRERIKCHALACTYIGFDSHLSINSDCGRSKSTIF